MIVCPRRRFLQTLTAPLALALVNGRWAWTGEDAGATKDASAARLREMNELARRVTIADAELLPEPIVRYDDQLRQIEDATLWAYGKSGRPAALLKVEIYRQGHALYGLVSLADSLIKANCSDGWEWTSTQPGVEMKAIPDATAPGASEVERLVQMRALSRRFSGYEVEKSEKGRFQMRLMTKPIDRYAFPQAGIQDGTIFSLANGTNPDVLIVIESRKATGASGPTWHYGVARMGGAELVASLDNKEVWRQAQALPVPAVRETYMNRKFPRRRTPE